MQLINYFITSAHAETTAAAESTSAAGGGMSFFFMFLIFFVFIYFTIWRPQNKRAREQQNLFNSLAKGDEVITASGLLGKIVKLNEQYVTVALGDQTQVIMQKSAIASVLPKGTIKTLE